MFGVWNILQKLLSRGSMISRGEGEGRGPHFSDFLSPLRGTANDQQAELGHWLHSTRLEAATSKAPGTMETTDKRDGAVRVARASVAERAATIRLRR